MRRADVRLRKPRSSFLLIGLLAAALAAPASSRDLAFLGTAEVGDVEDGRGLTLSPDGRHVYVAGPSETAIMEVSERADRVRLDFAGNIQLPGAYGADERRFFFSSDGRTAFLYRQVIGPPVDPVPPGSSRSDFLVFRRDPETGRLTLLATHENFQHVVTMSPDRRHVYSSDSETVQIHQTEASGGLVQVAEVSLSALTNGVISSGSPDLDASPEGRFVAAAGDDAIVVMDRDADSGTLEFADSFHQDDGVEELGSVDGLHWSHDGRILYAFARFTSFDPGALLLFAVDPESGELRHLTTHDLDPLGGRQVPLALVDRPDGRGAVLWIRDSGAGWVFELEAFFRPDPDGEPVFGPVRQVATTVTYSEAFSDLLGTLGDHLLLGGSLGIRAFDWTPAAFGVGDEVPVDLVDTDFALGFHGGLAVHPSGDWVYAASRDETRVGAFRRLPGGGLELTAAVDVVPPDQYTSVELAVSPDGRHLYATELFSQILAIYELDADTGIPSLVATLDHDDTLGLDFPRKIALSNDGRWLTVEAEDLALFERDADTGLVVFRDLAPPAVGGASIEAVVSIEFSDDARHLYLNSTEPAVHVLGVDTQNGTLSGIQSVEGGPGGIEGMIYPSSLALTPDGRHLIVGAAVGLFVFERDPATGRLDLVAEVATVTRPRAIEVDSDGGRVLVAYEDAFSERIELFLRDPATGLLELREALDNADVGVEGLGAALALDPLHRAAYTGGRPGKIGILGLRDGSCPAVSDRLCLGGDRFEVKALWRDFDGKSGTARVAPARTDDSGVLWYFSESNWEMLVKILDGCGLNDRFWVFAATASTVETTLTVTDRATGEVRTYFNPLGRASPALTDTDAFAGCGTESGPGASVRGPSRLDAPSGGDAVEVPGKTSADVVDTIAPFDCRESPTARCLGAAPEGSGTSDGRFLVEMDWRTGAGDEGPGRAASEGTGDSVLFWFFGPKNWEALVKVLDGCAVNGHHWVLSAATTDVETTLRITDSVTGEVREYISPLGQAASALADIAAFQACP